MQIDLRSIKNEIGSVIPFAFDISIAEIEPTVPEPLSVHGEVRNRAGYLLLSMTMEADVHVACDRCAAPIVRHESVFFEAALADHIEGEEDDSIIVCENDVFEPDELAASTFILELPSKNLCREDCKGLCPTCGVNLNESTCSCVSDEIDPRLSKLAQLLEE